ncbi:MAG: glycine zipper 2TM domain-containing protein [Steroidobacteraceae bacterium]
MLRRAAVLLCVLMTSAWIGQSLADPPEWAPAHGYRKKYRGYSGQEYDRDFAVRNGRCDREAIGAVLGGVAGGVIGNRVADPDNRVVGTVIGAAVGALVGAKIGREMDEGDRACMGHSFELAGAGRQVAWRNAITDTTYLLSAGPVSRRRDSNCRSYVLIVQRAGQKTRQRGVACRAGPGAWRLRDD